MLSNKNTMKKVNRLISFYNNTKKIVNNNILNNVNETAEPYPI